MATKPYKPEEIVNKLVQVDLALAVLGRWARLVRSLRVYSPASTPRDGFSYEIAALPYAQERTRGPYCTFSPSPL